MRAKATTAETTVFSLAEVEKLRRRASRAAKPSKSGPEGWSISNVDPMNVLSVFKPLRIKEG